MLKTIPQKSLATKFLRMFECDSARIEVVGGKLFLIIDEKVIASGKNEKELMESAKEYMRLCDMTIEQYLEGLINGTKS